MAELFGVVAGGIGAGSLPIQIIDKAGKLRNVLKSMKNAPGDIHEMLKEVELLTDIFGEIEDLHKREPQTTASKPAARTLKLCQEVTEDLKSLVKDLDACYKTISNVYTWKGVKTYRQKDKVKAMTNRAQRILKLLTVINQLYFHSLQSKKMDAILDCARCPSSETRLVPAKPLHNFSSCPPRSSALPALQAFDAESYIIRWKSTNRYWVFIGTIYVCNGTVKRRRKPKAITTSEQVKPEIASWKLQFHPSSWIKQVGHIMNGYMCFGNWQYTMTSYNLRAPDSPIFVACAHRDLETVRKLLDERSASPYDVSPGGATPLHVAAAAAAPEICQLLIERGADGNYVGLPGGQTPLYFLAQNAHYHDESADYLDWFKTNGHSDPLLCPPASKATSREIHDTVRFLVEKGKSDPMVYTTYTGIGPVCTLSIWSGRSETFQWLVQQEHFGIDLEGQYRTSGRSLYHDLATSVTRNRPDLILDALWSHAHISNMKILRDDYGFTMLHLAIYSFCHNACLGHETASREPNAWEKIVQGLLRAGSDVHTQNSRGETPLDTVLTYIQVDHLINYRHSRESSKINCNKQSEKRRHALIKWWLATLVHAGHDLKQYCSIEQSLHPKGSIERSCEISEGAIWDWTIHIIFAYGEAENDVAINWEDVLEKRDTHMQIPGSWVDESGIEVSPFASKVFPENTLHISKLLTHHSYLLWIQRPLGVD